MDNKEDGYVKTLQRRRDWLRDVVIKDYQRRDPSFARHECAALNWVLEPFENEPYKEEQEPEVA